MSYPHSREKPVKPPTEEELLKEVGDWVARLDDNEILATLLSTKKSDVRLRWITFVEKYCFTSPYIEAKYNVLEKLVEFTEVLLSCLEDFKRNDIVTKACRVAMLAYCWAMDDDFTEEIKPKLFDVLENKSVENDAKANALQALAVILATEPERKEKKIDWLFTYHLEPLIHRAVDDLHGAHKVVSEEEKKLLPTYLRTLNALILFSSQAHRQEALDSIYHYLVELLDHDSIEVKRLAVEGCLCLIDLFKREKTFVYHLEVKEFCSKLSQWSRDGFRLHPNDPSKFLDELIEFANSNTLVSTVPGMRLRSEAYTYFPEITEYIRETKDKRTAPDSGCCEAVFVSFLRFTLGEVFSQLVNIEQPRINPKARLDYTNFTDAVVAIVASHPNAHADFTLHYESLRDKGKPTKGRVTNYREAKKQLRARFTMQELA